MVGEPNIGFERHGQPRRGAGDLDRNQHLLQVAIPPGMGEPDVTSAKGFAQMEQDRDFPQAAPVILTAKVALPFRSVPQEGQGARGRHIRARNDLDGRQQGFGHGCSVDVDCSQHARRIAAEAMIPMDHMGQWVGGQGVGQLGRCSDQTLEG